VLDAQTGLDSGIGTLLAGLKGINMISGAGMMNFESTQSIQKLIIDNEICGMTYKLLAGIGRRDDPIAKELIIDLLAEKHLLTHEHTLRWFREELHFPGAVIDRANLEEWKIQGAKTAGERAWETAEELLAGYPGVSLDPRVAGSLTALMQRDAREQGLDALPGIEDQ
jgi:trimethylamine--corrinoid protein Co-methyltransferase